VTYAVRVEYIAIPMGSDKEVNIINLNKINIHIVFLRRHLSL
jgi:hypothetical protein